MKTLREEVAEVVGVMRRQLLDEIADELRARFAAKHAADVGEKRVDILGRSFQLPPKGVDILGRTPPSLVSMTQRIGRILRTTSPATKHIKTAWVKAAIFRLLDTGRPLTYSNIRGECRRGRRNVSDAHLGPILNQLKKSRWVDPGVRGHYYLGTKGEAELKRGYNTDHQ